MPIEEPENLPIAFVVPLTQVSYAQGLINAAVMETFPELANPAFSVNLVSSFAPDKSVTTHKGCAYGRFPKVILDALIENPLGFAPGNPGLLKYIPYEDPDAFWRAVEEAGLEATNVPFGGI